MLDVCDCGLGGSSCQSMLGQDTEPLMSMMHPLDDGNTEKCVIVVKSSIHCVLHAFFFL